MKKIVVTMVILVSSFTMAQKVSPKFEVVDNMVKATYFYSTNQIKEEGFYLDGKLHGKWTAYNEDGTKQVSAEYNKGKKTGKWFFWNENILSEVDYANSKITSVKKWRKEVLVNR